MPTIEVIANVEVVRALGLHLSERGNYMVFPRQNYDGFGYAMKQSVPKNFAVWHVKHV
jgi:hypothetical protein